MAGLSCYPAHGELAEVDALLAQAQELFAAAGLRCERISGGSTATLFESHRTRMTELRPGNYALLDRSEARGAYELGRLRAASPGDRGLDQRARAA